MGLIVPGTVMYIYYTGWSSFTRLYSCMSSATFTTAMASIVFLENCSTDCSCMFTTSQNANWRRRESIPGRATGAGPIVPKLGATEFFNTAVCDNTGRLVHDAIAIAL